MKFAQMAQLLFATQQPWDWQRLAWDLMQVVIYTLAGLVLFGIAYLIIDKVTPFSLGKELLQDKNVAMGIVLGSVFIGIALILAAAIRGY